VPELTSSGWNTNKRGHGMGFLTTGLSGVTVMHEISKTIFWIIINLLKKLEIPLENDIFFFSLITEEY